MATWLVEDAMRAAHRSAVHLETRDHYMLDESDYLAWQAGSFDPAEHWGWWFGLVRETVARDVVVRRARIVSEPVHDYIRFEHAGTAGNIEAGEQVRWLPRRRASDIALPGNDFWLFDDKLVIFNHFAGDGSWADPPEERREEPEVVKLCSAAFAAVWERAIPHDEYRPV
jgi:hypothetical protein